MTVDKAWLENKIKELNDWLQSAEATISPEYALKKRDRDYYVTRLIELEELGLTIIKT
jgi:hypothetical protein